MASNRVRASCKAASPFFAFLSHNNKYTALLLFLLPPITIVVGSIPPQCGQARQQQFQTRKEPLINKLQLVV